MRSRRDQTAPRVSMQMNEFYIFTQKPLRRSAHTACHKTLFTHEKGTLLPEKGHLAKLGGPGPPGSYAPGYNTVFDEC
jgi:hypothetical protein